MMLRTIPFLLLYGLSARGSAQDLRYFQALAPIPRMELNFMMHYVLELDPEAVVWPSDDMIMLQVRADAAVSDAQLRVALGMRGVEFLPDTPALEALLGPGRPSDAPPVYVATNNDAEDHARYVLAVQKWNTLHPQAPLHVPPRGGSKD